MMHKLSFKVSLALVTALLMSMGVACSGGLTQMSLTPQLSEARTVNSELRAEWTQTDETLSTTLTQVEQFPDIPIDVSRVDMNLVQKALTEAFNGESKKASNTVSSIATGDQALQAGEAAASGEADCAGDAGESMKSLQSYMKQAPDEVSNFIGSKINSVCTIKTNVRVRLPEMATNMVERYGIAKLKVEELKLTADTLKTAADSNPLLDTVARNKFNAQYQDLQTEIQGIEELLSTMETEVTELPNKVRETLEKFTYALSNFGQGG